jgi:hypothetical protein
MKLQRKMGKLRSIEAWGLSKLRVSRWAGRCQSRSWEVVDPDVVREG